MIETERLTLRQFRESDAEDVLEYLRSPAVHCFYCMKLDSLEAAQAQLKRPVVAEQLKLLRLRASHPAFSEEASVRAEQPDPHSLRITRRCGEAFAILEADLASADWHLQVSE